MLWWQIYLESIFRSQRILSVRYLSSTVFIPILVSRGMGGEKGRNRRRVQGRGGGIRISIANSNLVRQSKSVSELNNQSKHREKSQHSRLDTITTGYLPSCNLTSIFQLLSLRLSIQLIQLISTLTSSSSSSKQKHCLTTFTKSLNISLDQSSPTPTSSNKSTPSAAQLGYLSFVPCSLAQPALVYPRLSQLTASVCFRALLLFNQLAGSISSGILSNLIQSSLSYQFQSALCQSVHLLN